MKQDNMNGQAVEWIGSRNTGRPLKQVICLLIVIHDTLVIKKQFISENNKIFLSCLQFKYTSSNPLQYYLHRPPVFLNFKLQFNIIISNLYKYILSLDSPLPSLQRVQYWISVSGRRFRLSQPPPVRSKLLLFISSVFLSFLVSLRTCTFSSGGGSLQIFREAVVFAPSFDGS